MIDFRQAICISLMICIIAISFPVVANESVLDNIAATPDELFESAKILYNDGDSSSEDQFIAQKRFTLACEQDVFESCLYAAEILIEAWQHRPNKEGKRNMQVALSLIKKACESEVVKACTSLADFLSSGNLVERDELLASDLYRRACAKDSAYGCRVYANYTDSAKEKKELLEKSCHIGGINGSWACYHLARVYADSASKIPSDIDKAIRLFVRVCELGNSNGCKSVSEIIGSGSSIESVGKHQSDPMIWYKKACEVGHPDVCEKLGKPRPELTKRRKGCENSKIYDCHQYASYLTTNKLYDRTHEPDLPLAKKLFEKNCQLGFSDSCVQLSYLDGITVQDQNMYLTMACNDGHGEGCFLLGRSYLEGKGVRKDEKQAERFFSLACNSYEVKKSCRALANLTYDQMSK